MRTTLGIRFWAKVNKKGPIPENRPDLGRCWLWTGALYDGYGHIWSNGKQLIAHRVAYELQRGAIPDGLDLDHLCRVRRCMNADHLEPVTGTSEFAPWYQYRGYQCRKNPLQTWASVQRGEYV